MVLHDFLCYSCILVGTQKGSMRRPREREREENQESRKRGENEIKRQKDRLKKKGGAGACKTRQREQEEDRSQNRRSWSWSVVSRVQLVKIVIDWTPTHPHRHTNPFIFQSSTIAALRAGAECMGPYCSPQGPPQKPPGNLQLRFMSKDSKWVQSEILHLLTCLSCFIRIVCAAETERKILNTWSKFGNLLYLHTQDVIKTYLPSDTAGLCALYLTGIRALQTRMKTAY